MRHTGISNRESPDEEREERNRLRRHPDTARDRAGHVVTEEPAERLEREEEEHIQAPTDESPRGRRIRQSR
ncbi:MAG TPA: hypothetical protein VIL25_11950 [Vicinamibacterales bacterium]